MEDRIATIYGTQGGDTPQRILLTSLLALSLGVSFWIMYGGGQLWVSAHTLLKLQPVDPLRKALLAGALTLLLLRLCVTFFVLLSRRIPWPEAVRIPGAIALYFVGFPYSQRPDLALRTC